MVSSIDNNTNTTVVIDDGGKPPIKAKAFNVKALPSPSLLGRGQVCLNPADIEEIGGNINEPCYIQIANRVYSVACESWMNRNDIGLQPHHIHDAFKADAITRKDGTDCILASLFISKMKPLETLTLTVDIKENESASRNTPFFIQSEKLRSLAVPQLQNNFVAMKQEFPVPFEDGVFTLKVTDKIDNNINLFESNPKIPNNCFALIDSNTHIIFNAKNKEDLTILKGIIQNQDARLTFKIKHLDTISKHREEGFPKLIDLDQLKEAFLDKVQGKTLQVGSDVTLKNPKVGRFKFTLIDTFDLDVLEDTNEYAFVMQPNQSINILHSSPDIALVRGQPTSAESIEVSILSAKDSNYDNINTNMVDVAALTEGIKKITGGFVFLQERTIDLPDMHVRILIEKIDGNDKFSLSDLIATRHHYILSETGKVVVTQKEDFFSSLVPVSSATEVKNDTTTPAVDIKEAVFHVTIPSGDKRISILENLILEELSKKHGTVIKEGNTISIEIKNYPAITLKIYELAFEDNDEQTLKEGKISSSTHFKLITKSENLLITRPFPSKLLSNPKEFLEENGVGGISEDCIDHLKKVVLCHSKAKPMLRKLKIAPPKGMLLSGPPGTGKTNLARQLGVILGVPESNIIMKNGPEVFNMWVGNSEANVREMFEPAMKELEKYGDKSSPFLLIIDEIDAMTATRGDIDETGAKVVNQFISMIDGLKRMNNIFIIGLTNRVDKIDPAVLRAGRLNPTIKIGKPDLEGRHAIFRIHTREFQVNNLLHDDVNLHTLAVKSDGFTGADIYSLITDVAGTWALNIAINESDDKLQITMKDFEHALTKINQIKHGDKINDEPPFGMYT